MVETEVDEYKLNSEGRQQSLRISLLDDEVIYLLLTNKDTGQRYSAQFGLPQLQEVCQAFSTVQDVLGALNLLKETIEAGKIFLMEDPNQKSYEVNYDIIVDNKQYPTFKVDLLQEQENENQNEGGGNDDVQVLPPTFDYNGDKEAEEKYRNNTKNTTEYVKPIVKSNVKPPILQLEYIEPIVQVHYPDGTTKSHALPPRIQGVGGETPNISEEQFKSIREQMNKSTIQKFSPIKDLLSQNRSNSIIKKNSSNYSTQSTPYPGNFNALGQSQFNNVVRPAMTNANQPLPKQNINQSMNPMFGRANSSNIYTNNVNNLSTINNNFSKNTSQYSTMTMPQRPFVIPNANNMNPSPNITLQNNLNKTEYLQNSNFLNQNQNYNGTIERRPRMINMNTNNVNNNQRDNNNRSLSQPSHDNFTAFHQNRNTTIYQPNPTNNPFQINPNQFELNNQRYPYDRNTQRTTMYNNVNNIQNLNNPLASQNQQTIYNQNTYSYNNNQQFRGNNPQNNLSRIQPQQNGQRIYNQIEQGYAQINQNNPNQSQQLRQQIKIIPQAQMMPNQALYNNQQLTQSQQMQQQQFLRNQQLTQSQQMQQQQLLRNQQLAQSQQMQQQIQQQQLLRNQQLSQSNQFAQTQQIRPNQGINNIQQQQIRQTNSLTNNQPFVHKYSQEIKQSRTQMIGQNYPLQTKTSSPLPAPDISQKLISLAQMASMQNEANPNYKNLQAFTLEQQNQEAQQQEQEQDEIQEYQPQEETPQYNYEEQAQESAQETDRGQTEGNPDIEALFFTEDGRVIFRNGLLRGIIHKYIEIDEVVSKIQDILCKGVKFNLVYKAFDSGDKAKIFHEKCDKLNMSLVLIETDQDIRFGGFTTKNWQGNCVKKIDNDAFVFSLDNNSIFDVIENEPAIGCYPKFGPVFFGCQIRIYDDFFTKGGTTCHRGLNYKTKKDYELNNGQQKYLVKDIEVYSIETIDI